MNLFSFGALFMCLRTLEDIKKMANTHYKSIPDVYSALDVVSRELTGMIPAVTRDPSSDRVAVGKLLDQLLPRWQQQNRYHAGSNASR